MTYCVGLLVEDGMVMIADTRTNAGLDNVATFRKLHVFETPGERMIAVATTGNLAASQAVLSLVTDGMENSETSEVETIRTVSGMFAAARFIGRAIREVDQTDGPPCASTGRSSISRCCLVARSARARCACSRSIRLATSSRRPPTPPICRPASTNTASRSLTGRWRATPISMMR